MNRIDVPNSRFRLRSRPSDLRLDRDVQRAHRFVADQQRGLEDHRARDADALALPAAELVGIACVQVRRRGRRAPASRSRPLRRRASCPAAVHRSGSRDDLARRSCADRGSPSGSWKTSCRSRRIGAQLVRGRGRSSGVPSQTTVPACRLHELQRGARERGFAASRIRRRCRRPRRAARLEVDAVDRAHESAPEQPVAERE